MKAVKPPKAAKPAKKVPAAKAGGSTDFARAEFLRAKGAPLAVRDIAKRALAANPKANINALQATIHGMAKKKKFGQELVKVSPGVFRATADLRQPTA